MQGGEVFNKHSDLILEDRVEDDDTNISPECCSLDKENLGPAQNRVVLASLNLSKHHQHSASYKQSHLLAPLSVAAKNGFPQIDGMLPSVVQQALSNLESTEFNFTFNPKLVGLKKT